MKKYYKCKTCGNLFEVVEDSGMTPICCGSEMELLVPCSTDGIAEKHVPSFCIEANMVKVHVGEVPHPMTAEHHISWIALETDRGYYRKTISGDKARACFRLSKTEKPIAIYSYCNLHGLWINEI